MGCRFSRSDFILTRWKEVDPDRECGSVYFHPLNGRSFPANSNSGICYDDHVEVMRNYIIHDTYEYHTRELGSRRTIMEEQVQNQDTSLIMEH